MASPPNPRWLDPTLPADEGREQRADRGVGMARSSVPAGDSAVPRRTGGGDPRGVPQGGGGVGKVPGQFPSLLQTSVTKTAAPPRPKRPVEPEAVRSAPPWLLSFVAHLFALILLALCVVPHLTDRRLMLEATFADTLGSQLEDELSKLGAEPEKPEEPQVAVEEPVTVPEPDAQPAPSEEPTDVATDASSVTAPEVIGHALEGREAGAKDTLRAAYGGTALTEAAVTSALEWLKRNQMKDGRWSLVGKYSNGSRNENVLAATSMAMLAFQGNGSTHQRGIYKYPVSRGLKALLDMQSETGDFWQKGASRVGDDRLYAQAQGTIALCELYAMSRDPALQGPAQLAVDYAVRIQDGQGGWRYDPGEGSDTSVTGWFVMALQSARMGGLVVPDKTFERIHGYLDLASDNGGSLYGYRPNSGHETPMTAEALLCRQYLGWRRDNPLLIAGVEHLAQYPIDWNDQNTYYWYYATQVMHHMGDRYWRDWNEVLRDTVPAHQQREGAEAGSWSPVGDAWGAHGGRLYMTCLCTYMLEVYYRHLPIYEIPAKLPSPAAQADGPDPGGVTADAALQ